MCSRGGSSSRGLLASFMGLPEVRVHHALALAHGEVA